jgi:phage tail protein X
MIEYRTKEDDMLDAICYRYYGRQSGVVELVLAANQNLSRQSEQLPAGLIITLPDFPAQINDITPIRLWQ